MRAGQLLFISGQIALDPSTLKLLDDDIITQTHRVMRSIGKILDAAGASFENIMRTTVYLTNLGDFSKMNEVYETYVDSPGPARSTVEVARLPKGALVEIDAIAVVL